MGLYPGGGLKSGILRYGFPLIECVLQLFQKFLGNDLLTTCDQRMIEFISHAVSGALSQTLDLKKFPSVNCNMIIKKRNHW